jgi:hypothetical protein
VTGNGESDTMLEKVRLENCLQDAGDYQQADDEDYSTPQPTT